MGIFTKKVNKTVNTVFASFTKELEEVTTQQKAVISESEANKQALEAEKQRLDRRIEMASDRAVNAQGEINQAAQAMKNIGEMLGITTKEE